MPDNSATYHEPLDQLSTATRDSHRAIVSLMEELEAIDWYQQRAEACGDESLKRILLHNRDEEIEHASMLLEWLRRNHSGFRAVLETYLFTEGSITEKEKETDNGGVSVTSSSLGLGSLRSRS